MNFERKEIWTIGHSTHAFETFVSMLHAFKIQALADVRRYPGSKKHPQFSSDALHGSLDRHGIRYVHFPDLGGRRKQNKLSVNTGWKSASFRAYADYMETDEFRNAVTALEKLAASERTTYMCSEALWWRCHRRLISDYLVVEGWQVYHISTTSKASLHAVEAPALLVNGKLSYTKTDGN